jgi:uncharacterized membrane protein
MRFAASVISLFSVTTIAFACSSPQRNFGSAVGGANPGGASGASGGRSSGTPSGGATSKGGNAASGKSDQGGDDAGGATSGAGAGQSGASDRSNAGGGASNAGGGASNAGGGASNAGGGSSAANDGGKANSAGGATSNAGGGNAGGGATSSAGSGGGANPCNPNPCALGSCSANGSSYTCQCPGAYTGTRCELARFQPIPISVGAGILQNAEDISADGSTAVGEATDFDSINRVFRWTAVGGIEDLSSRLASPGYLSGVSSNGSVLAGVNAAGVFRWLTTGSPVAAPAPSGTSQCGINGVRISADGSTVVGMCSAPGGLYRAVRWRQVGGTPTPDVLPFPADATTVEANGVNADGTVVVGITLNSSTLTAVRWTSSGTDVIGAPPGGSVQSARSVSADGLVVVGDGTTATGATAIRWTPSGGTEVLPRPTANAVTFAYDTNQDGSVTVGTQAEPGSNYSATGEALLWNLSGVHYVRDLLTVAGVAPSAIQNWKLGYAASVSADGKVLLGAGTDPNGLQEAWIARLP